MTKIKIAPIQSEYSGTDGREIAHITLDGGPSRSRLDFVGAPSIYNVSWVTDREGFRYLRAFYKSIAKSGALPFEIDMIVDYFELTEHTVKIVPGSFVLSSVVGSVYKVSASLEVIPNTINDDLNETIVAIYGLEIEDEYFNLLNQIVNVDFPAALG